MIHLRIAIGALLTVLIETLFFLAFGFRNKRFVISCILINLLTNYALNYLLLYLPFPGDIYVGEALVVIVEALFYLSFNRDKKEVIPLTVASNILSFLAGLLYYAILDQNGWLL
jgi:O-antigen/teichoic acid export membrane protein